MRGVVWKGSQALSQKWWVHRDLVEAVQSMPGKGESNAPITHHNSIAKREETGIVYKGYGVVEANAMHMEAV